MIRRAVIALSIGALTALGLVAYGGVASATDPASATDSAFVATSPTCPDGHEDDDKKKDDNDQDEHMNCPSSASPSASSASPSASSSAPESESPTAAPTTTSPSALPTTGSNDVPTFAAVGVGFVLLGGLVVLLGLRRRRDASTQ
jgi:LPXTG-motif cell wall-anchored protein